MRGRVGSSGANHRRPPCRQVGVDSLSYGRRGSTCVVSIGRIRNDHGTDKVVRSGRVREMQKPGAIPPGCSMPTWLLRLGGAERVWPRPGSGRGVRSCRATCRRRGALPLLELDPGDAVAFLVVELLGVRFRVAGADLGGRPADERPARSTWPSRIARARQP